MQKVVPQAGLLGSLAGIGLALIGFIPLVDIFGMPLVGMVSLGLILYNLVAGDPPAAEHPRRARGGRVGTALYYMLGPHGLVGGTYAAPAAEFHLGFPLRLSASSTGSGGAQVPADRHSLRAAHGGGRNQRHRERTGGRRRLQHARHPAHRGGGDAGGRRLRRRGAVHALHRPAGIQGDGRARRLHAADRLFIGLGGILGYVSFIVELIPRAVLAPILIFVALDIIVQSFLACPARHAPAVAFAFFPTIARLLAIKLGTRFVPAEHSPALLVSAGKELPEMLVTVALGNGFILTAMLWGGFLAELIDRRLRRSALYLGILAVFTFFGIVHSVVAGRQHVPALDARGRAAARGPLPVCDGVPGAGGDACCCSRCRRRARNRPPTWTPPGWRRNHESATAPLERAQGVFEGEVEEDRPAATRGPDPDRVREPGHDL